MQTARVVSGECVQIGQTSTQTLTLFSSRMTWKRTGQEPPTINSHPASAAGHPQPPSRACTPPPGPPVTPNLSPSQPQRFGAWTSMGPGGGRGARRRGCLRTPPRPGLHACGRVEVRDHGSARGRAGIRGNGRSFPWPGGHESGGTCGMAVDGRGLMGSMRRRCFSSSSSLNTNSSIGRVTNLVRRDIPRGRADVIELVLRPEHAGIVSCTLTLPKYPTPVCR